MVIKDSSDVTLVTMDGVSYGEEGAQFTTLSSYSSLSEAVADIGGTKTVLVIDSTDTLNENVTVPSNITLMSMTRDAITLNSKTLTVNGDIWAGAFEWIIGTGTFAGSPVVQFYDPTWTASTVTDSATPSYKVITVGEPVLLTPVISDFSNATHVHGADSSGGLIAQSVRDTSRNLSIINATEKSVTLTADEAILQDSSGGSLRVANINTTADITNSGAFGLDVAPELTSTWFYIWLIGNSTGHASLISNSSTAPTLPSGYTYKGLFGAVFNDGSDNFEAFSQVNKVVQRTVGSAIIDITDFAVSCDAFDASGLVPANVKKIYGYMRGTASATSEGRISGNSDCLGYQALAFAAASTQESSTYEIPMESQNIYTFKTSANLSTIFVFLSGWEY
jgi:hypothetical protein